MAVPTYQSYSYTGPNTDATLVITKPSGLAVGDAMIAQYASITTRTVTPPTGFTHIRTDTSASGWISKLYWKTATSGDVAATDFTFTPSAGGDTHRGAIIRVDGVKRSAPVAANNGGVVVGTATISCSGVTPTTANSLIMLFSVTGGSPVSGHTIATSPPTFNERYDSSAGAFGNSGATGSRPEVTATGNVSITNDGGAGEGIAQILCIEPEQSLSISESVTMTEAVSIVRILNVIVAETLTMTDSFSSTIKRVWVNVQKNVESWVNRQK